MAKIGPDLFVGLRPLDTQNPPNRSPAKGEGSLAAAMDRLQLGTEVVSADDAVKVLVERLAARLLDALREAGVEVGRAPSLEVPADAAPEAVARRVFEFALSHFDEFRASNRALAETEARGKFAEMIAEAAGKAADETVKLLRGLRAFVSGEAAGRLDKVRALIGRMLEEFAAGEGPERWGQAEEAEAGGPQARQGREPVFVPRGRAGGRREAAYFEARRLGAPSEAPSARGRAPSASWGALGPEAGRASDLYTGPTSAQRALKVMGDVVVSNVRFLMGKAPAEAGREASLVEAPFDSTAEAAAGRVFEAVSGMFDEFAETYPASGRLEARQQFARLVGEALAQSERDTGRFFQGLKATLSGEAAGAVEKLKSVLAKMMDEFVAEGLKPPAPRVLYPEPPGAEASSRPAEQGRAGAFLAKESPGGESLIQAGRPASSGQAQMVPPESTVLAMTRRAHSQKMYASGQQTAPIPVVAYRPPLASLLRALFCLSVLINYPWELAQMVFFRWWGAPWSVGMLAGLKAAVGDGLLVLALYAAGCAVFRSRDWILRPGPSAYAFLSVAGGLVAVAMEWHAAAGGPWSYGSLAPMVPVLGVGLMPVVQMMVLPAFVAYLVRLWLVKRRVVEAAWAPGGLPSLGGGGKDRA